MELGDPLEENTLQGSALWSVAYGGLPLLLTVQVLHLKRHFMHNLPCKQFEAVYKALSLKRS
jgi:hypothetical protein